MKTATTATTVTPVNLEETREKFLRLLDTDRDSPEFQRLFEEVDRALAQLIRVEETED